MAKTPHTCADCGTNVPPQDDDSALISIKYGWRMVRKPGKDGRPVAEWRCPQCWPKFREMRGKSGVN